MTREDRLWAALLKQLRHVQAEMVTIADEEAAAIAGRLCRGRTVEG